MSSVSAGALNPDDTFRVISKINETSGHLLDTDDPVIRFLREIFGECLDRTM
jgi:hypothetical protein